MKYIVTSFLITALWSCGAVVQQEKKAETSETKPAAADDAAAKKAADAEKGMNLIAQSDCLGCHKISEQLVGPAYKSVAAKYEATEQNENLLAEKIVNGGKGVWGEVPMQPHPTVAKKDAMMMAKYVLSLK